MKESPTSNNNFKIKEVQTQSQILNQEEYPIPLEVWSQDSETGERTGTKEDIYSSPRYTHTYSVMSHNNENYLTNLKFYDIILL